MPSSDDQTSDATFREVVTGLDPVMVPLGFAGLWRIVAVRYDGFHDDHVERLRVREDVGLREQLESLRMTIPDDLDQWSQ